MGRYLIALIFLPIVILAAAPRLTRGDILPNYTEILDYHVEHNKLTPFLWQRALRLYLEQFDRAKTYLLASEVETLAHLAKRKLEKGISRFNKAGDITDFEKAREIVNRALERAGLWRQEMEREMVFTAQDLQPIRGETYLSYAKTEAKLRARNRKMLTRVLFEEKKYHDLSDWTPSEREAIFALWERRIKRREKTYQEGYAAAEHFLALHTLKALSKCLDANTVYFSEEEAKEMRASLVKEFEGVGVVLRETIHGVVITDLVHGGPAQKSGAIDVGDRILKINGKETKKMTYDQVLEALSGQPGQKLSLVLVGKSSSKKKIVEVERKKISLSKQRLQATAIPTEGGLIAVLKLPSFYEGSLSAEKDIRLAFDRLSSEGEIKGVILDLRENPGGFLTQAVKVAGLFITRGVVVISKYSGGEIKYLRNFDGKVTFDGPLIVLTSKASASASEIVAQALQDYGAALVVGDEHTYGKGTIQIQTLTDPLATAYYKVTVGRYYTVSGRSTQIEGVKADIVVPTIFSPYNIGERYLEYPLENDSVASAFVDPLTDVDYRSRTWLQKNYLPTVQKRKEEWHKLLPTLQKRSRSRLAKSRDFALFLETQEKRKGRQPRAFRREKNPPWGSSDLTLIEATHILSDMIQLSNG